MFRKWFHCIFIWRQNLFVVKDVIFQSIIEFTGKIWAVATVLLTLTKTTHMDIKDHITGVQHIGLPTDDIDRSMEFYSSLGFSPIYETVNEAAGERVAFMSLGNLVMEIYENRRATHITGAIDHVALDVRDIDTLFTRVTALGYNALEGRVCSLPFWEKGVKFFTIQGPDGEKIEFCERLR